MEKIVTKVISYNLGSNVLFDKLNFGENILVLYDHNAKNYKQLFHNFVNHSARENSLILYLAHKSNAITFDFKVRNYYYNVFNEDTIHEIQKQIDRSFEESEVNNKELILIADWSRVGADKCILFLPFLEELSQKSKIPRPAGWKRKYREVKTKTPFLLINAFETTNLPSHFIQQLMTLHQKNYLLQENQNTFLIPSISPFRETIFAKSHVLPQKEMEKIAKDNLKLITLLFLEKSDKSGYQILKEIAQQFHCILSQGTLYPLLYQLEKENTIKKENGKGREVVYSLTQQTKNELKSKTEICLKAYQHLASFFEERGGGGKLK